MEGKQMKLKNNNKFIWYNVSLQRISRRSMVNMVWFRGKGVVFLEPVFYFREPNFNVKITDTKQGYILLLQLIINIENI